MVKVTIKSELLNAASKSYRVPFTKQAVKPNRPKKEEIGNYSLKGKFLSSKTQEFFNTNFDLENKDSRIDSDPNNILSFLENKLYNAKDKKTPCGSNLEKMYFDAIEYWGNKPVMSRSAVVDAKLVAEKSASRKSTSKIIAFGQSVARQSAAGQSAAGQSAARQSALDNEISNVSDAWRAMRAASYAKHSLSIYKKYADHLLELRDDITSFDIEEQKMLKFLTLMNDAAKPDKDTNHNEYNSAFYAGLIMMHANNKLLTKDVANVVYHLADLRNAKEADRPVSLMSKLIASGCDMTKREFDDRIDISQFNIYKDLSTIKDEKVRQTALEDLDKMLGVIGAIGKDVAKYIIQKKGLNRKNYGTVEFCASPQREIIRYFDQNNCYKTLLNTMSSVIENSVPANPELEALFLKTKEEASDREENVVCEGDNSTTTAADVPERSDDKGAGWSLWSLLEMIKSAVKSIYEYIRDCFFSSKDSPNSSLDVDQVLNPSHEQHAAMKDDGIYKVIRCF
ncbi:hypothetical protein GUI12_01830 [Anaplasmataceae bacterium AB001_6]|nr:hypothetical protein GUI12_01830 [Anaplasmataceae bacterium AB001_6]